MVSIGRAFGVRLARGRRVAAFYLPVQGTILPVGSAPFVQGQGHATVTIPQTQALVGLNAWLAAVVVRPAGAPLVSYSVPFGPIIEDSIQ